MQDFWERCRQTGSEVRNYSDSGGGSIRILHMDTERKSLDKRKDDGKRANKYAHNKSAAGKGA
jgi:hypothetical protein